MWLGAGLPFSPMWRHYYDFSQMQKIGSILNINWILLVSLASKSQKMKKLTLLLVAAIMISGGAFAQEKACCHKGAGKCTKTSACCKDKKNCKHACTKDAAGSKANPTKQEGPKKSS
jgi:hypothetical protein